MTSQLNVDTIVDKAGSGGTNVKMANTSTYVSDGGSATQNTAQSLAKSWSAVNGSGTIAVLDSFNTASISDIGTGVHQVNYTSAMSNSNYSAAVSHQESQLNNSYGSHATDSVRTFSRKDDGTYSDVAHKSVIIHGDLA